jgi:hypothetical protein
VCRCGQRSPKFFTCDWLVARRERILLDRFYNELSTNPAGIDEQTRRHYAALYARPGAMYNALGGFLKKEQ